MEVLKKPQKIYKRSPKSSQARTTSESSSACYKFGSFHLDQAQRILLRGGVRVSLTPKVFDMLLILVQNAGRLVTKEDLLQRVWPDTFVEEANLSVNVATLRKVLDEGAGKSECIETLPKRGYRFVANVISEQQSRDASLLKVNEDSHKQRRDKVHSLAILPFYNESCDPNAEYLSDGLTESIINSLSHLKGLRIIGHNSVFRYRGKELDARIVGKELRVKSVVTGRILQLGERLIIRVEMIDVQTGWHIWGEQYHRKLADVLKMQQEVSDKISLALKHRLTDEEKMKVSSSTENAEAHKAYLKGRYHWSKFDLVSSKKAAEYFLEAIEIDPTYALAYAGLADAYYRLSNVYAPSREAMPKARAAAMKALEIDDTLSEAHAAMGIIKMFYEWDWSGAEKELNRAIESNHNNAIAHQRLGLYFNLLGRFDEATRELELAMLIDPLSPHTYWSFTLTYFLTHQYEKAIEEVQKTLEIERDYKPALYLLGRTYEQCGQLDQAIKTFTKILALINAPMFLGALGHTYARSGEHRQARKVLKTLQEQSKQRYVSAYSEAIIHLALGERNQTLLCLEKACEDRCEMMTWLKIDPDFEALQSDLRFTNLLRRVGLGN